MKIVNGLDTEDKYDVVFIGTGFGSLFFAHRLLQRLNSKASVLFIERGRHRPHTLQIEEGQNGHEPAINYVDVRKGEKPWNFTVALGGGTLCWWGQCPRFHPSDFELKSRHGVGRDWPISYEALETFYCDAEEIIGVSGDSDDTDMYPRSRPYPFPRTR